MQLVVVEDGPPAAGLDALAHFNSIVGGKQKQAIGFRFHFLAGLERNQVFTWSDAKAHPRLRAVIDQAAAHVSRPQNFRWQSKNQVLAHRQGLDNDGSCGKLVYAFIEKVAWLAVQELAERQKLRIVRQHVAAQEGIRHRCIYA